VRAGGNDDRPGPVCAVQANQSFRAAAQLHGLDLVSAAVCAEAGRLLRHALRQNDAGFAGGALAGIVLHVAGEGDLPAVLALFNDEGAQSAPARVQTGGQSRRTAAQNDDGHKESGDRHHSAGAGHPERVKKGYLAAVRMAAVFAVGCREKDYTNTAFFGILRISV
jgi:hypothetical protein